MQTPRSLTDTLPIRRYHLDVGEGKTLDIPYGAAPERDPILIPERNTRLPSEGSCDRYRFEGMDARFRR